MSNNGDKGKCIYFKLPFMVFPTLLQVYLVTQLHTVHLPEA